MCQSSAPIGHEGVELTPAEAIVTDLAERGYTTEYIANRLGRSVKTIETQLGMAYAKLGIHKRDELIERAEARRGASSLLCGHAAASV